jgi:hypothetical protein
MEQILLYIVNGEYKVGINAPIDATVVGNYNNIYELLDSSIIVKGVTINDNYGIDSVQYYTRTLSDDGRKRISETASATQKGSNNSQFGTRWIHSLEKKKSKKMRSTDPLPKGWIEGRKIKFD